MQATADPIESGVDTGPNHTLIRAHVDHIIGSPQFVAAPRLAKFLKFVVETVLSGEGDQIKESLIAIEVYGRKPDYNPQIDSTVRVEAGRLRARLRQYYETFGQDQPFEIELPKGRYVPVFRQRCRAMDAPPQGFVDASALEEQSPAADLVQPSPERQFGRASVLATTAALFTVVLSGSLIYVAGRAGRMAPNGNAQPIARKQATPPDAKTMRTFLRAFELLRLPVLKEGVVDAVPPTALESARLFEEVVQTYPAFAKGWVGLAEANEWLYEIDKNRPPELLIAAKAAARRAVELDPNLPEAWTILTSILFFREWDIPAAETAARRAMELNPRDTLAQQRYIDLLRAQGRIEEAAREAELAATVQPSSPNLRNRMALLLLETEEWEKAIREAEAAEALNPSGQQMAYTMSLWIQAAAHQRQGRLERAEAIYRKAIDHQPHDRWSEPSLGHLLAATGRRAEALEILAELQRQLSLGRPRQKAIALVYMGLGQHDEAMHWLERGFIERDSAVLFTELDWRFAPLRSNVRFAALLARVRRTSAPGISLAMR